MQQQNSTSKGGLKNPVNFYNTKMSDLDLNINNYSLQDLLNLFNISDNNLNEDNMKQSKQIVLKMHPDKSRLDPKFFIFFKQAYTRLFEVYEFQNKSENRTESKYVQSHQQNNNDFTQENAKILNDLYKKRNFTENKKEFNSWFNENFEKSRLEDPNERGYGDWMKSNDGIISVNENVSMSNMNSVFEQKKKQVQAVTLYNGIQDSMSSLKGGGTLLEDSDNFSGDFYTDLKQAYSETVIPVTLDDYDAMPKYNNISQYKMHRDSVDITPINKEEGMRILEQNNQRMEQQSQAIAYKYAKELEQSKEKQNIFWSALKQLTG